MILVLLIMIMLISGGILLIDRYKYFLSDPAKAFFWFTFVTQVIVLIASFWEGTPLILNEW